MKKQNDQLLEFEQNVVSVTRNVSEVFTVLKNKVDTLEEKFKLNAKKVVTHYRKEHDNKQDNQLIKNFKTLKNSLIDDKLSNWNRMNHLERVNIIKNLKKNENLLNEKLKEIDLMISVNNVNDKLQNNQVNSNYKNVLNCMVTNKAELDAIVENVEDLIQKLKHLEHYCVNIPNGQNATTIPTTTPGQVEHPSQTNSDFLITIKTSSNETNGEAYLVKTNKLDHVIPITLDGSSFVGRRTVSIFPPDFTKYCNLGRSLIITGGFDRIRGITLENCWVLIPEETSTGFNAKILPYPSMIHKRERHNMIYLSNLNIVIVCGGFYTNTSEYLDLNTTRNWAEIPNMKHSRGNATMAYINQSHVYCIGGFEIVGNNKGVYHSSIEVLDIRNMSNGWSLLTIEGKFSLAPEFKLCAMGVINQANDRILLIGGYDGSKYVNSIYEATFDANSAGMTKLEKLSHKLINGTIFQSNSTFISEGRRAYNFDYRCKLIIFDNNTKQFIQV